MPRDTSNIAPGRPGFSQEAFPEGVRKTGRRLALTEDVVIQRHSVTDDGGGVSEDSYTPDKAAVKGRIDPAGGESPREATGTINEATTHIVTLEPGTGIRTVDRVAIAGAVWRITAEQVVTDPWVTRLEVREV